LAAHELQRKSEMVLSDLDPENKNYLSRVISIGNDQLEYGRAMAATLKANAELNMEFIKIANNLIAEIQAADKL
jgi:hypothetical protein